MNRILEGVDQEFLGLGLDSEQGVKALDPVLH